MADYDRVIEMDENNLIARFNRGLLRAQVADNNRAIRDFDKVIELEPDNTIAYLNRAMLNNEIGNLNGALNDLNVVLEEHPDFFSGYYTRSYIKRELNDLVGAEQDYMLARVRRQKHVQWLPITPNLLPMHGRGARQRTLVIKPTAILKSLISWWLPARILLKIKYHRQSRGRVQNLNIPVEREPRFVLIMNRTMKYVARCIFRGA